MTGSTPFSCISKHFCGIIILSISKGINKKNWLFADTPKGASTSATIYSLVETAKANGINVYAYLKHLLLYMPSAKWQQYPEELDELMPWSPEVQAQCKQ